MPHSGVALITGDYQHPYSDRTAINVMLQVADDLKPDVFVINGDFVDWRVMSDHFPIRSEREDLIGDMRGEIERQRTLLAEIASHVKSARRRLFNAGNHEWRLYRALSKSPNVLRLLELEDVRRATGIPALLNLKEHGFRYSGEYPMGCWLRDDVPDEHNVWIEHGYWCSVKSGYLANRLIERRMISTVVGHGERLGVVWRRALGRHYFGCEGGNLSILAMPAGAGVYSTIPHTAPLVMDHQQGFIVVYWEGRNYYPYAVHIQEGQAWWNGKLYSAKARNRPLRPGNSKVHDRSRRLGTTTRAG